MCEREKDAYANQRMDNWKVYKDGVWVRRGYIFVKRERQEGGGCYCAGVG
jgi:hypothetical protein